ncbi:hypothetical protein [Staphylococcus agnetis]|uniref:hypothetical protein n=1 Tax=Staphylococcus agnetis TaxID=985762 RepID=UPI000CD205F0|nr:hypothetical protein [Staphylococcus agnetis]MBY7664344.1 hypothetical protein [Staphylococcus agnetis]NJH68829.1 hypothetical protein [Staphylococcus agnetis]NJH79263.1 hypothetical protein [Staphylococcus agnetis]PNY85005.1 hypothetical protein CD172_09265 [Staphylococcus agnetis]PTH65126.1 hypothetical protein BU582_11510 [Staphylococcus agnetis]
MNELQKEIEKIEDEQRDALREFDKQFDEIQNYKHQLHKDNEKKYAIFHELQQRDANLHHYQHTFERVVDEATCEFEQKLKDIERQLFIERDALIQSYQREIRQLELRE